MDGKRPSLVVPLLFPFAALGRPGAARRPCRLGGGGHRGGPAGHGRGRTGHCGLNKRKHFLTVQLKKRFPRKRRYKVIYLLVGRRQVRLQVRHFELRVGDGRGGAGGGRARP